MIKKQDEMKAELEKKAAFLQKQNELAVKKLDEQIQKGKEAKKLKEEVADLEK